MAKLFVLFFFFFARHYSVVAADEQTVGSFVLCFIVHMEAHQFVIGTGF